MLNDLVITPCWPLVEYLGEWDRSEIGLIVAGDGIASLHVSVAEADIRMCEYLMRIENEHNQNRRMGTLAILAFPWLSDAFNRKLGWGLWTKIQSHPVMCMFACLINFARSDVPGTRIGGIVA